MLKLTNLCGFGGKARPAARYWRIRMVGGSVTVGSQGDGNRYPYFFVRSIEFKAAPGDANLSDNPASDISSWPDYLGDPSQGADKVFDGMATRPDGCFTFYTVAEPAGIGLNPSAAQFIGQFFGYDFGAARAIRTVSVVADFPLRNGTVNAINPFIEFVAERSNNGTNWVADSDPLTLTFPADYATEWATEGAGDCSGSIRYQATATW